MPEFRFFTLGRVQITRDGEIVGRELTTKAIALAMYLAVTGEAHSREHLASLLWGDMPEADAQTNLRQALSKLRPWFDSVLVVDKQLVQFDRAACWVDVWELETGDGRRETADGGPETAGSLSRLRERVALYRGDFLATLSVKNAPEFEAWVIERRERYRMLTSEMLGRLVAQDMEAGEMDRARAELDRLLTLDPWNEQAHRTKMRLLARRGDKLQALAQFKTVRRILQDEFGVDPAVETIALYERIRDARPHSAPLPHFPTRFVGRDQERAAIQTLLRQPGTRLVTLLGPGGAGKTRLAAQVAASMQNEFLHGAAFVSLQNVHTAEQLAFAIGGAFNFAFGRSTELMAQLAERLHDQELVLVLDNFEQVVEAAPELSRLLSAAPDLKLLVTSRERLALQAEHVFPVGGMATAPEAAELFVARAQQQSLGLEPDEQDQATIGEIAQLVGGMPLALELAAGLTRSATFQEIAAHLAQSLTLLESDVRDAPARHKSLRAVFDESWRALQERERGTVAQLSVFQEGFDGRAAETIAGATGGILLDLADKAFLARGADRDALAPRYELHSVLSEFAAEKLGAVMETTRTEHARYYLGLVAGARERIVGETQAATVRELRADFPNVRAGWEWAIERGAGAWLDDSAPVVFRYLEALSQFRQAESLFAPAANLSNVARARYGAVLYFVGKLDDAKRELNAAREVAENAGAAAEVAFCNLHLANVAFDRGEFENAQARYVGVLAQARALEDEYLQIDALNNLGMAAAFRGDTDAARDALNECVEIAARMQETRGMGAAWLNLGMIDGNNGDYDAARREFERALPLFEAVGDRRGVSVILGNLGEIALHENRLDDAESLYRQCLQSYQELALPEKAANMTRNLGTVALKRGEWSEAQRLFASALGEYRRIGSRHGECFALNGLGQVALARGDFARADKHFRQGLGLALSINALPRACDAVSGLAAMAEAQQEFGRAVELYVFVEKHPAADGDVVSRARERLGELRGVMGEREFGEAQTRGQEREGFGGVL